MIQRIQSLWLLITGVLSFATFRLSYFSGNKLDTATNEKLFISLNASQHIVLMILAVAIAVASWVAIFLYKDRKRQLLVTGIILLATLLNIAFYHHQSSLFVEGKMDLTSIGIFSLPVLVSLAFRGIWKDEQLVKSADRLR